jgi:hypothetical protein
MFVRNKKWTNVKSSIYHMKVKAVKKACVGSDTIEAGVCVHLLYGKSMYKW